MTEAPTTSKTERAPFRFRWDDEQGVQAWARAVDAEAVVVLHHGPDDRWLHLDAPERFADWAVVVVHRLPACRSWVTVEGANRWPLERFVARRRFATGHLLRALDHQLTGHLLAAAVLRAESPGSVVRPGLLDDDRAYELRALLDDVLDAPARGVSRSHIGEHLRQCKSAFEAANPATSPRQRMIRRLTASAIPLEQALPRAIDAAYRAGV